MIYDDYSTLKPDHILLTYSSNPETTQTITFRTNTKVNSAYARFIEETNKDRIEEGTKVPSIINVFNHEYGTDHIHTVIIEGLKPGTKYAYQVGSEYGWSKVYNFTTSNINEDNFSFIVMSDIHAEPDEERIRAINENYKKSVNDNPNVKFITVAGDLLGNGMMMDYWPAFWKALEGIGEYVPFLFGIGNHDNREERDGLVTRHTNTTLFNEQFKNAYPEDGAKDCGPETYSIKYGNSQFTFMTLTQASNQDEWLYKTMLMSDSTWNFLYFHFSLFGFIGNSYDLIINGLSQIQGVRHIDLMFGGHTHAVSRSYISKGYNMYQKPSEGVIHVAPGHGANNPGRGCYETLNSVVFHTVPERVGTYTLCEVNKNKLTVTTKYNDGRVIDNFVIDKEVDKLIPEVMPPIYRKDFPRLCYKQSIAGHHFYGNNQRYSIKKDDIWFLSFREVILLSDGDYFKDDTIIKFTFEGINGTINTTNKKLTYDGKTSIINIVDKDVFISEKALKEVFNINTNFADYNNIIYLEKTS